MNILNSSASLLFLETAASFSLGWSERDESVSWSCNPSSKVQRRLWSGEIQILIITFWITMLSIIWIFQILNRNNVFALISTNKYFQNGIPSEDCLYLNVFTPCWKPPVEGNEKVWHSNICIDLFLKKALCFLRFSCDDLYSRRRFWNRRSSNLWRRKYLWKHCEHNLLHTYHK